MSLSNSFEKSGNFLFKYRGHLPLVLFVFAIPVAYTTPYELISKVPFLQNSLYFFCTLFVLIGHIIRILTVGRRFMQSSGRNRSQQVANELNTKGIYSIVRHPLYLGNALIWFGLVSLIENFWFMMIFIFLFWLYYERIMFAEEKFLESRFGDKFKHWSSDVPAFIPNFKHYIPSVKSFSWRVVFKNEYPGWISTLTALLFILILKRSVIESEINFTSIDTYFALFIFSFGLIFKGIKKFTKLFNPMD